MLTFEEHHRLLEELEVVVHLVEVVLVDSLNAVITGVEVRVHQGFVGHLNVFGEDAVEHLGVEFVLPAYFSNVQGHDVAEGGDALIGAARAIVLAGFPVVNHADAD